MLITLYGVNNIGKSTQARFLVERLQAEGHRVEYLKYPIYDLEPTGILGNQGIRDIPDLFGHYPGQLGLALGFRALQKLLVHSQLDWGRYRTGGELDSPRLQYFSNPDGRQFYWAGDHDPFLLPALCPVIDSVGLIRNLLL